MIDYHFSPNFEETLARIRANSRAHARDILQRLARPEPPEQPSRWLEQNIILKTPAQKKSPGQKAPWSFTHREYWREIIDAIAEDDWTELSMCFGTGNGKTTITLGHKLWKMKFEPLSGICVFPSQKGGPGSAANFVRDSLIPTLQASPCFAKILPTGAARHDITGSKIKFAGNDIDFVGSKSPRQISDKRCDYVDLQEQDKFEEELRGGRESGTDAAAMQRLTGGDGGGKITRSSTPTRETAGIWPKLSLSDFRLRFLPCPHCHSSTTKRQRLLPRDRTLEILRKHGCAEKIDQAMAWQEETDIAHLS